MVSSDTVVGIVGAVILTGAMIAVFYYEAGRDSGAESPDLGSDDAALRFAYVFNETMAEPRGGQATGTISAADSPKPHAFDLPAYSSEVHVVLAWTAATAPEDLPLPIFEAPQFQLIIRDEHGTQVGASTVGSSSPQSVTVTLADNATAPPTLIVGADSEMEADELVQANMTQRLRQWRIEVVLADDGDPTGSVGPAHAYSIETHVTHWEPRRDA